MPATTATAVNAGAILGIVARLEAIVTQPNTFLSFPLAPIAYPRETLRFLAPGGLSPEQAQGLAEFAELVNRLPTGPVWGAGAGDRHLWDIYGSVLGADLATSTRTPEEEKEYDAAWAFLHAPQGGGGEGPSRSYLDYRAFQKAWLDADAACRQAGQDPTLAAARDVAMERWIVNGNKVAVEEAMRALATLGQKSPALTWQALRSRWDPSLPGAFQTGLDGSLYAPTGFAPSDVFDTSWQRIQLDRADLDAAAGRAPAAIVTALDAGDQAATIESVGFDYTTVAVTRPWLDSSIFTSRAWRFGDGEVPLSDGAEPPSGRCTAYVASVVLARNLQVAQRAPAEAGVAQPATGLAFLEPLQTVELYQAQLARPGLRLEGGLLEARTHVRTSAEIDRAPVQARTVRRPSIDPGTRPSLEVAEQLDRNQKLKWKGSARRLQDFDFVSVDTTPAPPPPPPPPPPPGGSTVTTPPEAVYLMAFLCQRLPRCPDPDLGLEW